MNNIDLIVLAIDLGASSGRTIVGFLKKDKLTIEPLYSFSNGGIHLFNSSYWNILGLYQEILISLKLFVKKYGTKLNGIGIDTWGVDFVLLNSKDEIIGYPHHYRDKRTDGILKKLFKIVSKEELFNHTGIQMMAINSSSQLFSMVMDNSPQLSIAKSFLMIPDYINFLLSGVKASEYSIATTSQLYNPITNDWAYDLIHKLGYNKEWFCKIVKPGTILGNLNEYITKEVGLSKDTKLITPLCHDTGSAIAAVPVDMEKYNQGEWAYLSSGTWSLLGVELEKPLISQKALNYNFTNEGGINRSIRFLKNITGMWIIQECKRIWNQQGLHLNWTDIDKEVEKVESFKFFINPNDTIFLNPTNMIQTLQNYCRDHDQKPPESIGEISKTIFESLAFCYRQTIENLEDTIEKKIKVLHIIGGGTKNVLLNQFTANILRIPVIAGPVEATAIGNILVQCFALGKVKNINQIRTIVRKSFPINEYLPKDTEKWETGYKIYLEKIQ